MKLGERIRERRERIQMSQAQLGSAVGVSRSAVAQWESGIRSTTLDKIEPIATALHVSSDWLLSGEGIVIGGIEPIRMAPADPIKLEGQSVNLNDKLPVPSLAAMPVDLPEIGVAAGGASGDFSLNGQTIDYKRRPPGLTSNRSAFAIRVIGDSMFPRFEEGELIYIDPKRPPRIGDYILIELKPERGGEPGHAYIKRLLAKTPTKLRVGQYNPAKENIEIPLEGVLRISTVLQLADLLGV